jgi:hypothetical protein
VLKQYGNRIHDWSDGVKILHQAAREGNAYIVGFLLDSVQVARHTDTVNELLLTQDHYGRTAWHLAAVWGNIELLEELWRLAKQKLTPGKLKYQLLLGKSSWKENAWHVAVEGGNIQVLEKLWEWANEKLTPDELHNKLLLGKDHKREPPGTWPLSGATYSYWRNCGGGPNRNYPQGN